MLIVGCGDVGMRVLRDCSPNVHWLATTSQPARTEALRAAGAQPIVANLDEPQTLRRLAGVAQRVLHLAPPPNQGFASPAAQSTDPRTLHLLRALALRKAPGSIVYGSTSGVYGDCEGDWVTESRPLTPSTARALRRVDAENAIRFAGRAFGIRTSILRIPGIYAPDREGGTPRERLLKGTPVLLPQDDVYTNHIHADDLARACWLALWRAKPQRAINVSDDSTMKMGDYFDLAADLYDLPRPPRVSRDTAQGSLPLMLLSFMSESRRLRNDRMKLELRLTMQYPHVRDGLAASAPPLTAA